MSKEQKGRFEEAIKQAEKYYEDYDHVMAIFVLRDLPETKEADLDDLAWAYYKGRNIAHNEVRHFIDSVKAGRYLK